MLSITRTSEDQKTMDRILRGLSEKKKLQTCKHKRFLVFAGDRYYPDGGWNDMRQSFDKLEDAVAQGYIDGGDNDGWWHVVDMITGEKVGK